MKRRLRILTTGVITAAAAAGIVFTAARYRAGGAFQPTGSDREMQNNQVLFPDSDAASGAKDEHFSSSAVGKLPEDEENYEVRFGKAYDANAGAGEALYRGQTVDLVTLFQSLEAFVWDYNTGCNYYWTLNDLMQSEADEATSYVRIDGYSFDVFGTRFDAETTYPFTIPEDEYYLNIYISYRFSLEDDWTAYTSDWSDGVFYELMSSRVIALDTILRSEGEVIDPAHIANLYNQYLDGWTNSINLLQFQNKILGARGTRLESLFPGWKEDGELVPFIFTADVGRHVLEPAGRVPLSEDYQVEVENQWMDNDYIVGASTDIFSSAKWVYLQTLTRHLGRDAADNSVERLSVPQYVQAVDFLYYPGLTADYLELPETVLYVNTGGIPSFMDDELLYDRGLAVAKGYTVAEGNPRYAAEDGVLYNLDRSEILGVPTEREELIVGSGVTRVSLPYQNALDFLILDLESLDTLPEVN